MSVLSGNMGLTLAHLSSLLCIALVAPKSSEANETKKDIEVVGRGDDGWTDAKKKWEFVFAAVG